VIRHREKYYAYRNLCPHQGGPACEGLRMPQVVDQIGKGGV
jgi:nitrite reductase/ring-hydroxylating ferredoxin subunit